MFVTTSGHAAPCAGSRPPQRMILAAPHLQHSHHRPPTNTQDKPCCCCWCKPVEGCHPKLLLPSSTASILHTYCIQEYNGCTPARTPTHTCACHVQGVQHLPVALPPASNCCLEYRVQALPNSYINSAARPQPRRHGRSNKQQHTPHKLEPLIQDKLQHPPVQTTACCCSKHSSQQPHTHQQPQGAHNTADRSTAAALLHSS